MNPASATAQVWLLFSALVGAVTVVVLVVAGLRRCWWSLRSDHDPLWRAAGLACGLALLALAAMAAGCLLAATLVPGAKWAAILAALTTVLLWAASLWSDRAPDGLAWPGRPTGGHTARSGLWVCGSSPPVGCCSTGPPRRWAHRIRPRSHTGSRSARACWWSAGC